MTDPVSLARAATALAAPSAGSAGGFDPADTRLVAMMRQGVPPAAGAVRGRSVGRRIAVEVRHARCRRKGEQEE